MVAGESPAVGVVVVNFVFKRSHAVMLAFPLLSLEAGFAAAPTTMAHLTPYPYGSLVFNTPEATLERLSNIHVDYQTYI